MEPFCENSCQLNAVRYWNVSKSIETCWIRLQGLFTRTVWRHLCKTSWRCLEDVLKTSWRCLESIFPRRLEHVLKTSWRLLGKASWKRLEDVLKKYGHNENIRFDQGVLNTSSADEDDRRLQDVFIKRNVCWDFFQQHIFTIINSYNNICGKVSKWTVSRFS